MRSKFPIKTKIAGLVITTFLLIILALSLYLFVVIRNNERQIINRSFRTLAQISQNIKAQHKTFVKNVAYNAYYISDSTNIQEDSVILTVEEEHLIYSVTSKISRRIIDYTNEGDSVKEVNKKELYSRLKREDVFDAFIIREGDSSIIYNTLPLNIRMNRPFETDSTLWQAGDLDLVTIGAIDYKRFTLPLKLDENRWWYLDGLIENSHFQSEKKSLGTWFVIIMVILFIFIVLSFPVLRLFLMSSVEQMRRSNLFLAGGSVIFGTALVVVLLVSVLSNSEIQSRRQQQLQKLADTVNRAFTKELSNIYRQLETYDSLDSVYFTNDILLRDSLRVRNDSEPTELDSTIYLPEHYPFFKITYWIDRKGNQLHELKTRNRQIHLINLSYRDYFKLKDAWRLPGCETPDSTCRFMIESIYSNTSGEALAAVSKRSTGWKLVDNKMIADTVRPTVVAMTSPMYSVMDPVLPKAYTFSIIDAGGKVWFHSNKRRNLQENLLEECSHNRKLQSAIYSRTPEHIRLHYQNKDYRIYIQPIRNIPLFLVTMEESSLMNSYNSAIITLSLLFIIIFLGFIGIQVFVAGFTDKKKSRLKRKKHVLDWLLPQYRNAGKYPGLVIGHLLILISVALWFFFGDYENRSLFDLLFAFLYAQIFITLKARFLLKNGPVQTKNTIRKYFDAFNVVTLLFWAIIIWFHIKISEDFVIYLRYVFFQLGLLLILAVPWSSVYRNLTGQKSAQTNSYFPAFHLFLISWLLLISVLPSILFFKEALLTERKIERKYQQLHLVREFQSRNNEIDNYYATNKINDTNDRYRNQRKSKGIYTRFMGIDIRKTTAAKNATTEENSKCDSLLLNLRPLFSADIIENRKLIFSGCADFSWTSKPADSTRSVAENSEKALSDSMTVLDSLELRFYSTELQAGDSVVSKPNIISASLPDQTILGGYGTNTVIFWLLLVLFILLLILLLANILRRIFPFTVKTDQKVTLFTFHELLKTTVHPDKKPVYTFAVDLSGEDTMERKKAAEEAGFKCIGLTDGANIHGKLKHNDKVVLLDFDFITGSPRNLEKGINILETLVAKGVQANVISSSVTPIQLYEFYDDQLSTISNEKEKEKLISDFSRLRQLLLPFSLVNCSLQQLEPKEKNLSETIRNELKKDVYLASLSPLVREYCSNHDANDEDAILFIQHLATGYYEKIWESCTIEEKILLVDLAEDSLVNIKNNDAWIPLRNLQEKGVVEVSDKYKIMNESFRNYILTNVETSDLENTEIMKKRKSAWNSFRIPLILFASGILIFLFATQQALISNLYTLLIAVGAIAGVFIRISGMFSPKSKNLNEVKANN